MPLALVTGATGYLGSVTVDQLLDAGYKMHSKVWKEAVDYLAKKRPELKDRLPVVTGTERVYDTVTYDASSATKLIGLTEYISWEETLESTIDDILRREAELDSWLLYDPIFMSVFKLFNDIGRDLMHQLHPLPLPAREIIIHPFNNGRKDDQGLMLRITAAKAAKNRGRQAYVDEYLEMVQFNGADMSLRAVLSTTVPSSSSDYTCLNAWMRKIGM
ncbi:hypothetical protein HETIRDRAFT_431047 [Heterobasidion irregulare TC 32-1]|uniref:NAD-dependent epimerase/dehydratase domain-containing protein n=1 Tax=Heterobasidion irregulare (strain TC 32-1) TaxID=747525 RepID=W4JP25_HETIT|nr:uncharacterized protein HETIRDRAFT_431047 [Heterobasidion irregulare TC 32-1]ETW74820.1 hypothetical protein HETIRDRAFT_431047 [Heterobasidion irregulare TC 32-1]